MAIVEEDIDVAIAAACLSRLGASAYHVQQAAEKLVKALLVLAGEPFRRTHDLDDLVARLVPVFPEFVQQGAALRRLSVWGVAYRYPSLEDEPEPLPDHGELERMIGLLKEMAREAGGLIDGGGGEARDALALGQKGHQGRWEGNRRSWKLRQRKPGNWSGSAGFGWRPMLWRRRWRGLRRLRQLR